MSSVWGRKALAYIRKLEIDSGAMVLASRVELEVITIGIVTWGQTQENMLNMLPLGGWGVNDQN